MKPVLCVTFVRKAENAFDVSANDGASKFLRYRDAVGVSLTYDIPGGNQTKLVSYTVLFRDKAAEHVDSETWQLVSCDIL